MDTAWQKILEPYAIDDDTRAMAYEHASPQQRQMLKTAIAYHALQGEGPSTSSCVLEYKAKGFWQRTHCAPAPTLFILCGEEYVSPARLVAAVMPALLAGVGQCIFVHVSGGKSLAPALLVALELLGLEEAYALSGLEQAKDFIQSLAADTAHIHNQRLLLLHQEQSLASLRHSIQALHMPYFEDKSPPYIFVAPTIDQAMRENIAFAQPDAYPVSNPFDFAHAYYGVERPSQKPLAQSITQGTALYQQHYTQNMEACWHMNGLDKNFFLNHYVVAGTTFDGEDEDER